jgi:hypothetical protein
MNEWMNCYFPLLLINIDPFFLSYLLASPYGWKSFAYRKVGFVRLTQNSLFSGRYSSQFNASWSTGSRDTLCRTVSPCALSEAQHVACTFGLRQLIISHRGEVTAKITQWLSLSMKKERPGSFKCLTCEVQGDHLVTWLQHEPAGRRAHRLHMASCPAEWQAHCLNEELAIGRLRHWTDSTLEIVGNFGVDISKCMALHQRRKYCSYTTAVWDL